jgi:hypothetical protein
MIQDAGRFSNDDPMGMKRDHRSSNDEQGIQGRGEGL